ncbi:hypothetical protein OAH18_01075 [bacterium]|nr:hypothetical protein [bacterium]
MERNRPDHRLESNRDSLFEDQAEGETDEQQQRIIRKRRTDEHVRQTVVQKLLVDTKEKITTEESGSGQSLNPQQRVELYGRAIDGAIDDFDESTIDQTERDTEESRIELKEKLAEDDNRLDLMKAVVEAELEDDLEQKPAKRTAVLKRIETTLKVEPQEAQRIYAHFAANPGAYRQLIELETARTVLKHKPERFEEYVELLRVGDQEDIDRLFSEIAEDDQVFAARVERLTEHRRVVIARVHQLDHSAIQVDALLGDAVAVDELSTGQQVALAETLDSIDQPIRETWSRLAFEIRPDGLHARWLGTELVLRISDGGAGSVVLNHVPVLGGVGQDFFAAKIIGQMHDLDDELPVSVWRELSRLVDFVGPGFQIPDNKQTTKAVRLLKSLGLHSGETRNRLGILSDGAVEHSMLLRLRDQIRAIAERNGDESVLLNSNVLIQVVGHWREQLREGRQAEILDVADVFDMFAADTVSATDNQ